MTILGDYSVENFLAEYWQQKPLLIKGASCDYGNTLSADELAGMACEESVESRLIIEKASGQWTLENGPLQESRFSELPDTNWTLLVQSVDQWLPGVRDILNEFDFLSRWRLDDVMISYATPGGGVGPHFDYYDVFLLQTRGKRHWKLGQSCNQDTLLREGQPLKLLAEFEQTEEFDLQPGDMLYIPASVAHWGTGLDDECMTWSIGFRAPSAKELLTGAIDLLADKLSENLRYRDSLESLNGPQDEINSAATQQLNLLRQTLSEDMLIDAMADVLGAMSTEPRYPELIEEPPEQNPWTDREVNALFEREAELIRNDASRLAYRLNQNDKSISKLYVNGDIREVNTELARAICAGKIGLGIFDSEEGRAFLLELLNSGAFLASD